MSQLSEVFDSDFFPVAFVSHCSLLLLFFQVFELVAAIVIKSADWLPQLFSTDLHCPDP